MCIYSSSSLGSWSCRQEEQNQAGCVVSFVAVLHLQHCRIQQSVRNTTMQLSCFNHCFFLFCHCFKNFLSIHIFPLISVGWMGGSWQPEKGFLCLLTTETHLFQSQIWCLQAWSIIRVILPLKSCLDSSLCLTYGEKEKKKSSDIIAIMCLDTNMLQFFLRESIS